MQIQDFPEIVRHDLVTDPIEKAKTLGPWWYQEKDALKWEYRALLGTHWQYVCASSEVAEVGAFRPEVVSEKPILLVRDNDGSLNGFFNVCRHRAGPIAHCAGRGKMLRCQYHGWSYKLNGELVGTPRFDGVQDFSKDKFGLRPIQVHEWHGMVFAKLVPSSITFAEVFAGIGGATCPVDMDKLQFAKRVVYRAKCNWKIYVENYMEGYHVPFVHPELSSVLDTSDYHTDVTNWWSLQYAPLQDKPSAYSTKPGGRAEYFFVNPNMMFNILPGRCQINSVVPVGPDQCDIVFDYYYEDAATCGDTRSLEVRLKDDLEFSDVVQKQDIDICEAVQRGMNSGAYEYGRYSVLEEKALHHFHDFYRKALLKGLD
jgi:choline monooxygenase